MEQSQALILTPTARLARAEQLSQARRQIAEGRSAWLRPDVLSLPAWLARLREDYFLSGDDRRVPIDGDQALALWQSVIDHEVFVGEPQVAELAHSAWRMIHEYGLARPEDWDKPWLSEDQRSFRHWAARFTGLCRQRRLVDEWAFCAELPELINQRCVPAPSRVVLRGFDLPMPPLKRRILDALAEAGSQVEQEPSSAEPARLESLTAHPLPDDELKAAACWARRQLESNPGHSVAVVVPDLEVRLASVERIFRQVFDPPGFALHPAAGAAFHVSLGPKLSRWPLIAQALLLLGLSPRRISHPQAVSLLRSPFIAGGQDEAAARSRLVTELIGTGRYWLDAGELIRRASRDAPELSGCLQRWRELVTQQRRPALPSEWAGRFQQTLSALGFGQGRMLDSVEFQALGRWHELLETLSRLDVIVNRPLSRSRALRWLRERARTAVFRQRNPGAQVEILGVQEALGSRFDALWITSLDSETWPSRARRHPLIPGRLQSGVPGATVDGCLAQARLELTALLGCARQVRGSLSLGDEEEPRRCSPLVGDFQPERVEPEAIEGASRLERLEDDSRAPALTAGAVRGGASVLQNQSDCPFRAFAIHRLGASDLSPPRPGLDARDRGALLHRALEHFWRPLADQAALLALSPTERDQRINLAADRALAERWQAMDINDAGAELEAECLRRALAAWLELETARAPFTIDRLECEVELTFDQLQLQGKIDRIDLSADGGAIVIDYKTGRSGRNGWVPDVRLADVQLPAYALAISPRPVALSFARLRADDMGFEGLGGVDVGINGIEVIGRISRKPFKSVESWPWLLEQWQSLLDQLAEDFVQGRAEVDPRSTQVCRNCHLHGLCRIDERVRNRMTDDD